MLVAVLLAAILAVAVGGCNRGPRDLALSSVNLVNSKSEQDLDERRPPAFRAKASYLKVEFTSSTDLGRLANEHKFAVLAHVASSCDNADDFENWMSFDSIYWNGLQLDRWRLGDADTVGKLPEIPASVKPPYTYYGYVKVEGFRGSIRTVPFNLRKNPRDICFFIHGAKFLSAHQSNPIVIDQETLSRALAAR